MKKSIVTIVIVATSLILSAQTTSRSGSGVIPPPMCPPFCNK